MGKLGIVLIGGTMLSKSLIQFSVDGWGCVPSIIYLRPNYGRGNAESAALNILANLDNSAVATGLERVFSFQSQRKAMPRNAQSTSQLHSSHTLVK